MNLLSFPTESLTHENVTSSLSIFTTSTLHYLVTGQTSQQLAFKIRHPHFPIPDALLSLEAIDHHLPRNFGTRREMVRDDAQFQYSFDVLHPGFLLPMFSLLQTPKWSQKILRRFRYTAKFSYQHSGLWGELGWYVVELG